MLVDGGELDELAGELFADASLVQQVEQHVVELAVEDRAVGRERVLVPLAVVNGQLVDLEILGCVFVFVVVVVN